MEFHQAVESGNLKQVKEMLEVDPSLVQAEIDDQTPFEIALARGYTSIASLLIHSDLFLTESGNPQPLRQCINLGYTSLAEELLRKNANPNERPENEPTLLRLALCKGYFKLAEQLLEMGSEIDARDEKPEFDSIRDELRNLFTEEVRQQI